jgi:aminopeptidase N
VNRICFSILVLLLPLTAMPQQIDGRYHHDHHLCALVKTETLRSGTYPQNPLLWDYQVSFYGLDVTVDPRVAAIAGSVRVLAEVSAGQLETFVLELKDNMSVDSVLLEGQILPFEHVNDEVQIRLPAPAPQGDWLDITVYYHGEPEASGFFSGFQIGTTPFDKPVLWTLSEPVNARQWWPVKQVLEDKADSVHVFITTPSLFMAASNGLLTQVVELPEDWRRYEWKSYYPIAYYLISLAVSEYAEYNFMAPLSDPDEQVLVQNFIYDDPSYLQNQKENIERTIGFMQLFSTLYGDYPFATEKYGHATAPMGGGMEHQTMSTMAGFSMDLTSHELAHQWFGNNVTCATWSDIWINEGFATYSEYLAREFIYGRELADAWMQNAHNSVMSAPGGSVYVPPVETTNVWRIFNGRLSYRKGAALLHMLRFEINNDPLFFQVLQVFQDQFRDSVATGDDFMRVVEQVTGSSWQYFFSQWYYGEGFPIFSMEWWQDGDQLMLRSRQNTSTSNPDFFRTSLVFHVHTPAETIQWRVVQEHPDQAFSLTVDEPVEFLEFDPDGWLLKQAAVMKLDEYPDVQVKVFPNPFSKGFTISSPFFTGSERFRITDLSGRVVAHGYISGTTTDVVLPNATGGVMILEITSNGSPPWMTRIVQVP